MAATTSKFGRKSRRRRRRDVVRFQQWQKRKHIELSDLFYDVALDDDLNDDGEYVAPPFNPHDLRCILTS